MLLLISLTPKLIRSWMILWENGMRISNLNKPEILARQGTNLLLKSLREHKRKLNRTAHRQRNSNEVDYRIAAKLGLVTQMETKIFELIKITRLLEKLNIPNSDMHYTIRDNRAGQNSLTTPVNSGK